MALSPGARLGPYEITAQIGVGGMGEVYRAKDTRLPREVAIKVSAQRFSERFAGERQTSPRSIIPTSVVVNWGSRIESVTLETQLGLVARYRRFP